MIEIDTKFTNTLDDEFRMFEESVRDEVLLAGVAKMAAVVYEEVKANASRHVLTGTLLAAVYRAYSPEKSKQGVQVYNVSVNKSDAPHWHFLELGTSRQAAQPFIRPATDKLQDAVNAGEKRMSQKLKEVIGNNRPK